MLIPVQLLFSGLGRYFTISAISVYMPLARIFDPMSTGTIEPSSTFARSAALISSSENSSPPKYLSMNSSLVSATASTKASRHIPRFSFEYSGTSNLSTPPLSFHLFALCWMTLTYPTNFSFSLIGRWNGAIFLP